MLPDTLAALLAFLCLVVPGLLFELLRERRRPAVEETAFREASRVALTSALFSGTALLVFGLVRAAAPSLTVDPGRWLREGGGYAADNLARVTASVFGVVLLACTLALFVDWLLRRPAPGQIQPGSIWYALFRLHRPPHTHVRLHMRLNDGSQVVGYLGDYTPEHILENRELVLRGGSLQLRPKEGETDLQHGRNWQFVTVRGSEVTWMRVGYIGQDGRWVKAVPARRPGLRAQARNILKGDSASSGANSEAATP